MKKWNWLIVVMILLVGCDSKSLSDANSNEREVVEFDTKLNVAIAPQPDTLDQHMTTTSIVSVLGRNIYEQLVTFNSTFEVIPMLAESVEESEDGKTYTFHLRQGVKFHNGKEMKAEDVVASLEKWHAISTKAQAVLQDATFTQSDEYTVEMTMKKPVYGVLSLLADLSQSATIMPKEIAEAADATGAKDYIGTGPFKFEEWKQDQYVHVSKFEDYSSLDRAADGVSGKKEALVDDIYFHFVNDSSTRLLGLQSGEFDIVNMLPYDDYDMINNDPNLDVAVEILGPIGLVFNKKEGVFSDIKIRQAINAALDVESLMISGFTNEDFYRLDHGHMIVEQEAWYNEEGKDRYNINDPEKAKQLLEEAGYNGEEIKLLASRDYEYFYSPSVVIQEQLKNIGVNVKLEVTDWATVMSKRAKPGEYDGFVTAFHKVPTPQQLLYLGPDYPGWTDDPQIADFIEEINAAKDEIEAKAAFAKVQDRIYDYLPFAKFGDYYTLGGLSAKVDGMQMQDGFILWNTTKAK